jgi:hypothetical protein
LALQDVTTKAPTFRAGFTLYRVTIIEIYSVKPGGADLQARDELLELRDLLADRAALRRAAVVRKVPYYMCSLIQHPIQTSI